LYNCIAFAAGETHRWWWPMGAYWPEPAPRDETVDSFIRTAPPEEWRKFDEDGLFQKELVNYTNSMFKMRICRD